MKNTHIAIGIDIGGSHISCGAVDLEINRLIPESCFEAAIDNKASAARILEDWVGAIWRTIDVVGFDSIAGIGFAMPGPFDYVKGIGLFEGNEKYPELYGVDIQTELRQRLNFTPQIPIRFMNDATAFAIAEGWIGEGRGYSRIIALTLGTGFGSAFLADGIPVLEGDTVPSLGCVWHLPFGNGIADDYFSTRWFEKSYLKMTGKIVKGVKEISELFDTDEAAHSLMLEYGTNMGDFLSPWIKKFGATHIVIGGNITGAYDQFGPALNQAFIKHNISVSVSLSILKENAAIIGSARMIDAAFFKNIEPLLSKM